MPTEVEPEIDGTDDRSLFNSYGIAVPGANPDWISQAFIDDDFVKDCEAHQDRPFLRTTVVPTIGHRVELTVFLKDRTKRRLPFRLSGEVVGVGPLPVINVDGDDTADTVRKTIICTEEKDEDSSTSSSNEDDDDDDTCTPSNSPVKKKTKRSTSRKTITTTTTNNNNDNNNDNNNNNNNKSSTTNTTTVKIWRPSTSPTDTGHSNGSMYCADAVRYVMTREVVQHQQTPTVELLMEWNQLGMDTKEWIYDFVLEKFGSLHGQEVVVEGRLNFDYEMRRGSENGPWADLIPFDGRDLWQFTLINNDSHEDNMWQADPASFVNLGRKERARCWPWSEGDELPFRRTGADAPMTGNGPNGAISVHVNLGPFLSHKRESNDPKSYQASAA